MIRLPAAEPCRSKPSGSGSKLRQRSESSGGVINKAMIEIPPKFAGRPPVNPESRKDEELFKKNWRGAQGLAEDVRYYGQWMRDEREAHRASLPKVEITPEMAKDGQTSSLRWEEAYGYCVALGAHREKP